MCIIEVFYQINTSVFVFNTYITSKDKMGVQSYSLQWKKRKEKKSLDKLIWEKDSYTHKFK